MSAPRLGEAALIARHFAPLAGEGAEGLRDDAAWLVPTPGHDLVLTADAVVAGVHFFPDDPAGGIARKALGTNLSDLAAKGARPCGFLLSLALPGDWREDWLAAFAAGLGAAADDFACPLLGGDTVRAGGLLIAITALGETPHGAMVRRSGARAGDRLCVTGTIGDGALGLLLRRDPGGAFPGGLDAGARAHLLDRYHHPQPRNAVAEVLRRHARAAMDVSDGLAGDLARMLGPGLTARVEIESVPLSTPARAAVTAAPDLWERVLTGGDDYEILAAVPPEALDAFLAGAEAAGVPARAVGAVAAGEGPPVFVDRTGGERVFAAGAFDHF